MSRSTRSGFILSLLFLLPLTALAQTPYTLTEMALI